MKALFIIEAICIISTLAMMVLFYKTRYKVK